MKVKSIIVSVISILLLLYLSLMACYAAPVESSPREVKQADGTVITIRSFGDEYFDWTETMDGYVVEYDWKSENWYYAVIVNDRFVPGPNIVGNNDVEQPWMLKDDDVTQLMVKVYGCVLLYPQNNRDCLSTGETLQLYTYRAVDRFPQYKITLSSSDPEIATVDDKGVVTAIVPGEVIITATGDHREVDNTATCKITVTSEPTITANPSATFAPTEAAPALKITCVDVDNPSEPLYEQQYVYLSRSEQTIYAPDLSGYTLIDQTPQIVTPEDYYSEIVFNYKKGREPNATPLPIEPLSESTPEPWVSPQPPEYNNLYNADLTVVCVDKDDSEKILYRQTIKDVIGGSTQVVSAPPIEGYTFCGDSATVDEYISFGENTVVFNYNKADLPAETPVEYELIKIKRDIIAALKASDPERYSDYNDDSDIYLSDYQNIRVLNIDGSEGWSSYGKQIEKIDYLEYMINLEELTVEFGYLRELDLSNNTKLKKLNCSHNALFGIDLSKNTELEELDCSYNGLLELDFSSNKKLKKVNCSNNWIDNINVMNCENLYQLDLSENCLTNINIDTNQGWIGENGDKSFINLYDNYIDPENNTEQAKLIADLAEKLLEKDCTITCTTTYKDEPNAPVKIDSSLLEYLLGNNEYNTGFVGPLATKETLSAVRYIRLEEDEYHRKCPVLNLSGIEYMTNLENITCSYPINIRNIDISNNININAISIIGTSDLKNVNLGSNSNLIRLQLSNCDLSEIDLSGCCNIETVSLMDCRLNNLDVSKNLNLKRLWCQRNNLTSLDLSQNSALEHLICSSNKITSLELNENSPWNESLEIENNYLDISEGTALASTINTIKTKASSVITNPQYNYLYIINGMSILNQVGEVISTAPQINENFNVKIEVNKIKSNDINGYIILAVYDMKGGLLNIDCAEANFDTNSDYASFDFSIPAQRAEIDSIRAFIWSGVNSMNPLAETKTIYFTN